MFKYDIFIKSGTSGHYDYDDCSLSVKNNFQSSIPLNVGDILMLNDKEYIVNEILIFEGYNVCYVLRVYGGEDREYIKAFDCFTDIIINDPGVQNEQLKRFAKEWIQDRKEGIIRL